jgi:pimeloyl-ACP methyl ester carboxylesterase
LAARSGGKKGTAALAHLIAEVRKLPRELWPVVRSHWSHPKCFSALSGYLGCLPDSARSAQSLKIFNVPTVVLSASTATQKELEERNLWASECPGGQHIYVPKSGHWLHLEYPDVVSNTIAELARHVANTCSKQ